MPKKVKANRSNNNITDLITGQIKTNTLQNWEKDANIINVMDEIFFSFSERFPVYISNESIEPNRKSIFNYLYDLIQPKYSIYGNKEEKSFGGSIYSHGIYGKKEESSFGGGIYGGGIYGKKEESSFGGDIYIKKYIEIIAKNNEEINKLKNENKELKNEINIIKNENIKFKKFEEDYKKLEKNYETDTKKLNNQIIELTNKYKNTEKNNLNEIKNELNNDELKNEIIKLSKELRSKEEELEKIKSKIGFEIKEDEQIMTLIFTSVDQKIQHSFICKDSDKLHQLEGVLYDIFPEYANQENIFLCHGTKINKFKTMKDNKIKNSDIVVLVPLVSEEIEN